jgi:hypothetical protein
MIVYSKPEQTYKGMWRTELTEGSRIVLIVEKTTKKALMSWIKADKQSRN